MIKQLIKTSIKATLRWLYRILPHLPGGEHILQQMLEIGMSQHASAKHKGVCMKFATPNALCRYRVESFSDKEPDTLKWIDNIPSGSIFWDIGANIGLYSIYAAKARDCQVFSFEPSVFNLEQLARNIQLNDSQHKIVIIPVALSNEIGPNLFKMSSTSWGGALSTFGQDFDQHGETLTSTFEYHTMGMTMTDINTILKIPMPQYIKIDVDGIEHFILHGGIEILNKVDSVLIEINDDFLDQAAESSRLLKDAGLTMRSKFNLGAGNQYNQWWVRQSL